MAQIQALEAFLLETYGHCSGQLGLLSYGLQQWDWHPLVARHTAFLIPALHGRMNNSCRTYTCPPGSRTYIAEFCSYCIVHSSF